LEDTIKFEPMLVQPRLQALHTNCAHGACRSKASWPKGLLRGCCPSEPPRASQSCQEVPRLRCVLALYVCCHKAAGTAGMMCSTQCMQQQSFLGEGAGRKWGGVPTSPCASHFGQEAVAPVMSLRLRFVLLQPQAAGTAGVVCWTQCMQQQCFLDEGAGKKRTVLQPAPPVSATLAKRVWALVVCCRSHQAAGAAYLIAFNTVHAAAKLRWLKGLTNGGVSTGALGQPLWPKGGCYIQQLHACSSPLLNATSTLG
jgi:hypothetical protein